MKFTETHEWIKLDNDTTAVIGITDFAQQELGEVVYVELPKIGAKLRAGDEACVIESTKAAADIYSPVTGKVTEVNKKLLDNPGLINQGPQKDGWLFKVALTDPEEVHSLLDLAEYESLLD